MATLVPAGEANGAVADFGAPLDGRALLQWMPEQFGTGHSYTAGQAVAAAQRYDVISAFPQAFGSAVPSMRSANPRLVLLAYSNGMFAPATRGPASANPFALDWYARDASGNYIQNASNNNWLMNPANSGWVQNRASNCATLIAQSGYDGCMLDTLGVAPLTAGYCTSLAYNAATGANWTRADWLNATTQLAAAARSTVTPSLVVGNGLKDGPSIAESQQLFNGMDGAMAESFLRAATQSASTYPSVTTWQQNVDMLSTPPKPILAVTKLFAQATSAQAAQWHLFSMASFLLGTDGRSYFYFASSSSEQPISTTPWTTGVGSPTAAYGLRDGVYQRPFTNGRVVVNPSASAVTVPLDGVYTRQDGTVVAGSLSMPPSTGEVLTNSSAAVPDAPTGVTATAGDASVVVSFVAPQNDGGSAVTGYTATATDGADGSTVAATGNASPITIGGLTNGHSYTVSVAATNAVGTGASSAASGSVTPRAPATVPDAPTGVTATAGDASVVVSFVAPQNDGGSAVTGYTATATDGADGS
ncbi:MAG: putative glycoside hydrolase, partial [Gaiellales bacterium]